MINTRERAKWILDNLNTLRRDPVYQLGWLAGHLASILEDDPRRAREFKQQVDRQRKNSQ